MKRTALKRAWDRYFAASCAADRAYSRWRGNAAEKDSNLEKYLEAVRKEEAALQVFQEACRNHCPTGQGETA